MNTCVTCRTLRPVVPLLFIRALVCTLASGGTWQWVMHFFVSAAGVHRFIECYQVKIIENYENIILYKKIRVAKGNLLLRHSIPHALPSFRHILCVEWRNLLAKWGNLNNLFLHTAGIESIATFIHIILWN